MAWGIHRLKDMIGPPGCSTPHGRAVPEPYSGRRLLKAWWVLTGRAEAVIWPEAGELERAVQFPVPRKIRDESLAEVMRQGRFRDNPADVFRDAVVSAGYEVDEEAFAAASAQCTRNTD